MTEDYYTLKENSVLKEAIKALYFDDAADYETALWQIVTIIDPEAANMLENDREKVWELYVS